MSLEDELLSAYIDGEVEAPHDAHIRRRIEADEGVRQRYEKLLAVHHALRTEALPDFSTAQSTIWAALEKLPGRSRHTTFWRQQWHLPAPLVAAAALVFAFLLGFSLWNVVAPTGRAPHLADLVQSEAPVDLTINLADADVDRLLAWLSSRDMMGEVKVELPDSHTFRIIGEAELLRAADYGRSNR